MTLFIVTAKDHAKRHDQLNTYLCAAEDELAAAQAYERAVSGGVHGHVKFSNEDGERATVDVVEVDPENVGLLFRGHPIGPGFAPKPGA